jgi:hypothetical protein
MTISGQFDVEFKKDGSVHDEQSVDDLLNGLAGATDMIVLAHGWNNDIEDAKRLYDRFLASVSNLNPPVAGLDQRHLAVLRVFWPSKKFAETDLIPGGGVASATTENDEALRRALDELKRDPQRLGGKDVDPARGANIDQAIALVNRLEQSAAARREFVLRIRTILNPDDAHEDDGSREFFERDPEELFDRFGAPVPVDLEVGAGGAASLLDGITPFLGDFAEGAQAAARRIANFATYFQMKTRAGTVGAGGVAATLLRVRATQPKLPFHLVGHSFGARLVTAAASRLPPNSGPSTLTLLQGAFSHNALSSKFDGQHDGAFRTLLADQRVSGPIVITHTKNDLAVGVAYPLASRIARDAAAALGDQDDPYGGMGRNGAQHTPEVAASEGELRDLGNAGTYAFGRGKVFNLNGDRFIKDHGDVTGLQVTNAFAQVIVAQ